MSQSEADRRRRKFLAVATSVAGAAATAGAAVPFVASLVPSERARAAGAPVEFDLSSLGPGQLKIVEWRGKPIWVLRRTDEMLADVRKDDSLVSDPRSEVPQQPPEAKNEFRAIDAKILVLVGVCTHLGCSPQFKPASDKADMGSNWNGGFYCPCHGSKFDLAGRVLRGSPAPTNLVVPPYRFASADMLVIGESRKKT